MLTCMWWLLAVAGERHKACTRADCYDIGFSCWHSRGEVWTVLRPVMFNCCWNVNACAMLLLNYTLYMKPKRVQNDLSSRLKLFVACKVFGENALVYLVTSLQSFVEKLYGIVWLLLLWLWVLLEYQWGVEEGRRKNCYIWVKMLVHIAITCVEKLAFHMPAWMSLAALSWNTYWEWIIGNYVKHNAGDHNVLPVTQWTGAAW